jgi:CRISPR-associated protein Csm1
MHDTTHWRSATSAAYSAFLYTIVTRNAARALRGRSLALQLLTDAIAHRFLDSLGLPAPCLLYNGGGKIWLLLPASSRDSAFEMAEAIDLQLHAQYAGRLSFSLGTARVRGLDFIEKRIAVAFEALPRTCKLAGASASQQ